MATASQLFRKGAKRITLLTGEDLSGHINKPAYLSAENTVKLMTTGDGTQDFIGFIYEAPVSGTGVPVDIAYEGIVLVVAQTTFNFGRPLKVADSQGRLALATDNLYPVAKALETASAINHIVAAMILQVPIKGDVV